MVTPEQRLEMYLKTWRLIREKGILMADFWNCGAVASGCISGGRSDGYFYIDWNGNVMPCVFNPHEIHNIIEVYRKEGNLYTVLFSSFFKEIRYWQEEYALNGPAETMGNIIVPCAIRDHYEMMFEVQFSSPAGLECPSVPVSLIGTRDIKQPGSLWINYGVQVRVIISKAVEVDGLGKKKQIFTT